MAENLEIKLLKGFCAIPFGSNKDKAVEIFGEPEEIQTLTDDILNNNSVVYHYWNEGFSLFFDLNRNQSFCSVEIDNKDALLFDVKVFALKEKELIELMRKNGYPLSDTEVHKWGKSALALMRRGWIAILRTQS